MNVPQLLDEVRRRVPVGAPAGTRWKASAVVAAAQGRHEVAAAARIDAQGRRREQFWCDGLRVEQSVLLRLTCPEGECPHARQVRAQWLAYHQAIAAPAPPAPPRAAPLMAEVAVSVGRHRMVARPARFPCFTPCPNGAHPPMTIDKAGFDLFDNGGCVGGGVVEVDGRRRPRIPTVQAAEAFVLARHLETLACVAMASAGVRQRPRPTGDGGGDGGGEGD